MKYLQMTAFAIAAKYGKDAYKIRYGQTPFYRNMPKRKLKKGRKK